jgi:outer membrane protein OmpA-like peptidoglycan-associated protein
MTIKAYIASVLYLLLSNLVQAQHQPESNRNIADCNGAIDLIAPGTYNLQLAGSSGKNKDLSAYPSLKDISEKHIAWTIFTAPFDGRLSLEATLSEGLPQLIVFQDEKGDLCNAITQGSAEIKRMIEHTTESTIGLSLVTNAHFLYPLDLKKGQQVAILFLARLQGKGKPTVHFTVKFEAQMKDPEIAVTKASINDQRSNKKLPGLHIMIRDVTTGNPVVADLRIEGFRNIAALYSGSDFLFNIEKSGKITIKCDAAGYFYADREEALSKNSEHELMIWLEPLGTGKSVQLEDIEFKAGTSEFMPGTEPRLRRLKDFLALNNGVHIEIQGHVQQLGENTYAAQKISEARAKKVMKYLIDSGISKDRMVAKGYGNTKPVYADPKFTYEEQANRRVEIKIL